MPDYDIIIFGDTCVDLIINGTDVVPEFGQVEKLVENYTLEMGGSCCIFTAQAAKLGLKIDVIVRRSRDIARAARPRPNARDRVGHGGENFRMLSHAEVVVRAPDGDLPTSRGVRCKRSRKRPGMARIYGEIAIPAFELQLL